MKTTIVVGALSALLMAGAAEVNRSYASRAVSSVGETLDSSHLLSVDWSEPGRFEMIKIGFLLFFR